MASKTKHPNVPQEEQVEQAPDVVEQNQEQAAEQPAPTREEELAAQLEALKAESTKQKEVYLRMLAEYDNFRKRTASESDKARVSGIATALTALLPAIDSVNRAIEMLKEDEKALAGIQQIKRQFEQALTSLGVEEIKALGEEFDPEVHNAVMQEEDADNAGKVIQVLQAGYRFKQYVIRPAMVKVAV
ncbi:MAG: nucleotide exchange factor GrpE [Clostridia bacterium]|nr:nucleotide exchange factor GrpE [Clostridia bacterium]